MNWVDYSILGVLALSVLVGLWRGLISEVMAVLVWVAAFWVAWLFGDDVAAMLVGILDLPSARIVLGYAACFLSVLIAGALLSFVLRRLVEGTGLSGSDRLLGMIFGLARGLLLVTLVVMMLGFTPFPRDPWWQQSKLMPRFTEAAMWLGQRLPPTVTQHLDFRPASVAKLLAVPGAAVRAQIPNAAQAVPARGHNLTKPRN